MTDENKAVNGVVKGHFSIREIFFSRVERCAEAEGLTLEEYIVNALMVAARTTERHYWHLSRVALKEIGE